MFAAIFLFFFTYWAASDLLCLLVLRVGQARERDTIRDIFFLSRGLGPIAISWLLYNLILLFPKQAPATYLSVIALCFAGVLLLARRQIPQLLDTYVGLFASARRQWSLRARATALLCLIAGIGLFIFVIAIGFPIVESDALSFATEARILFRDLAFEQYPRSVPDPETGYYFANYQAQCLEMVYVWFFLFTGTASGDLLVRTVSPMYAFFCLLLLCWVLYRRCRVLETACWGGLALIATPIFAFAGYMNTQDPHRIYFFFSTLVLLDTLIDSKRKAGVLTLGFFVGFAIYSHFFNFVLLVIVPALYLWFYRDTLRRKLTSLVAIGMIAFFFGASYHYARPAVAQRVMWEFPVVASLLSGPLTSVGLDQYVPEHLPTNGNSPSRTWLDSRRGQLGAFNKFFFGKLQVFTGIESFGIVFWIVAFSVPWWLRRAGKTRLDIILGVTAILCMVVVLSDLRIKTSSNPRYIATLLPIVAYFSALSISATLRAVTRRRGARLGRVSAAVVLLALVLPLAAATAVRGAKVGLTNPGDLYERLHNLTWVGAIVSRPIEAARTAWDRYLGIKKTVHYFSASEETKLQHSHDFFAAVAYMNASTPETATALVFRFKRYFYYAHRRGIGYGDPRVAEQLYEITDVDEACNFLAFHGIDHVLIDTYYSTHPFHVQTPLAGILSEIALSTMMYQYRSAKVYKLHCNPLTPSSSF